MKYVLSLIMRVCVCVCMFVCVCVRGCHDIEHNGAQHKRLICDTQQKRHSALGINNKCCYAECYYAECHFTKCSGTVCVCLYKCVSVCVCVCVRLSTCECVCVCLSLGAGYAVVWVGEYCLNLWPYTINLFTVVLRLSLQATYSLVFLTKLEPNRVDPLTCVGKK